MKTTTEKTATKKNIPWHSAFYAGIQIEFQAEVDKLIFENEHHLGTQPKRIDVLVIKKEKDIPIEKNIGKLFRKHNIIEYKSPEDYISIDDFYLVYGYACLYKADSGTTNEIPIEELTITFVCRKFPQTLVEHLKKERNYNLQLVEKGIYYIVGDFIPIQLLVTKDLTDDQNLWLHNLTNDIQDKNVVQKLFDEYQKHQKETHYKSIMDAIVHANLTKFKEETAMCKALEEIFLEVHGERLAREQQEAIDKAVAEAVAVAVAEKDAFYQKEIAKLKEQLAMATA